MDAEGTGRAPDARADGTTGMLPLPAPTAPTRHLEDTAFDHLVVLERRRRLDRVARQLDESGLGGRWEVLAPGIPDQNADTRRGRGVQPRQDALRQRTLVPGVGGEQDIDRGRRLREQVARRIADSHPVGARVEADRGFGERVDVDGFDVGAEPCGDDGDQTAAGCEVEHGPPRDLGRVIEQPARQSQPARPRERPERDRRTVDPERLLGRVPDGVDGIGEVKADAGKVVQTAQPRVPLDERASMRERQAAGGRLDAGHRAAGYRGEPAGTGYTPAS
jgi:hypothetical protein